MLVQNSTTRCRALSPCGSHQSPAYRVGVTPDIAETRERVQRKRTCTSLWGYRCVLPKFTRLLRWRSARARQLCQHLEDPQQLFPVLRGLHGIITMRAKIPDDARLGRADPDPQRNSPRCCHAAGAHRAAGRRYSNWRAVAAARTPYAGYSALRRASAPRLCVPFGRATGVVCRGHRSGRCNIWDILTRG